MNIEELRNAFPLVAFSEVTEKHIPMNEDAFYPFGSPKGETIEGTFIRIVNVKGGADTIDASNIDAILKLAEWHQNVGVRHSA